MKKEGKKILVIVGLIVTFIFLFQSIDLARAKDPDYPTKPITFYISYGAGGTTDLMFRAFCDTAKKYLGQPFVPINKVGAGGTLVGVTVINSKPDGYTFGSFAVTNVITMPLSGEAPYKDLSGFTLIGNFANYVYPLMVKADAPWKTWKELIEWARKNPRGVKLGIVGAKSNTSFGLTLWQAETRENVEFTYIPLKSSAETLSAILGGHITLYGSTVDPSTMVYVKEGKLRILAFMDTCKVPGHENIPSFQELYGFSIINVMGVLGPKSLPDYVLKKWDDAFAKVVKDPDFVSAANRMFTPVVYMNRAQINKYMEEIYPKAGEIIRMLQAEEAKQKK
jgi:tripartite-type tricarboxylate transporter receptor subunit TctC